MQKPKTPETVKVAVLRPIRVPGQGDNGSCRPGALVEMPFAQARYLHNVGKVFMAWKPDLDAKEEAAELKKQAERAAPRPAAAPKKAAS